MINERIAETIRSVERFMETVDDSLALPRESAEFLHALVLARGAKRAVEIGTSYGYSGLWTAAALTQTGGTLVTIDREQRKTDAARANLVAAGLDACVDFRTGPAAEVLATLDGPIDFVLNDADKVNCRLYVELLTGKLSDYAVVLTDNIHSHAEELAGFVEWIRYHSDFVSVGVPIGSGLELSVKCVDRQESS